MTANQGGAVNSRKATGGKTVYGARVGIHNRLGIPIFDVPFVRRFHSGLEPRDYGHPGSSTPPVWRER
jgi:hypothetical protein